MYKCDLPVVLSVLAGSGVRIDDCSGNRLLCLKNEGKGKRTQSNADSTADEEDKHQVSDMIDNGIGKWEPRLTADRLQPENTHQPWQLPPFHPTPDTVSTNSENGTTHGGRAGGTQRAPIG